MAYNAGPNRIGELLQQGEDPGALPRLPGERVFAERAGCARSFGWSLPGRGPRRERPPRSRPLTAGRAPLPDGGCAPGPRRDRTAPMRVTEIFFSLQGEGTRAGRPCVFVRFTGCDLRCVYCDTSYAFQGGEERSRAGDPRGGGPLPCRFVLLTGGEPMLQRDLPALARELLARGYEVAVETHGQAPLDALPREVIRIADVKTPGSGQARERSSSGWMAWRRTTR